MSLVLIDKYTAKKISYAFNISLAYVIHIILVFILEKGYLVILHALLLSADFFSKSTFSKNYFRNTIRVSNSLDPDQGSNCLQRLSADETSRQRVHSYSILTVSASWL